MKLFTEFKKTLPSAEGKVFVITGTTSGTGYIAAQTVAELGGQVILLNRPSIRADASIAKLRETVPNGTFVPIDCNLQDFSSVRNAVKQILDSGYDKIYCLANNAGIMATPDRATVDGYDEQMQTNHFSHFLLTALLFPLIEAASLDFGDARIIQQSSVARHYTPKQCLEEKYLEKNGGNLGGDDASNLMKGHAVVRYQHSKLANAVFGYALHDKIAASTSTNVKNIRAIGAHPGISKTSLFDDLNVNFSYQSAEDGTMGLLTGMLGHDASSGVLYGPQSIAGPTLPNPVHGPISIAGPAEPNPPKYHENNPEALKMLWRLSEKATGQSFNI